MRWWRMEERSIDRKIDALVQRSKELVRNSQLTVRRSEELKERSRELIKRFHRQGREAVFTGPREETSRRDD